MVLLKSLKTEFFRNLGSFHLDFDPGVSLIYGDNGRGKTNIIEAIFVSLSGKSFRTSRLLELAESGSREFYIFTDLINDKISTEIKFCYQKNSGRKVFINSNPQQSAFGHFSLLPVVSFTPDDHELIGSGNSLRRSFVDRIISSVDEKYFNAVVSYQKILKSRNQLLSEFSKSNISRSEIIQALSSWNQLMVSTALEIVANRLVFLTDLSRLCKDIAADLYLAHADNLEVNYKSCFLRNREVLNQVEALKVVEKCLDYDLRLTHTSKGIHRDEVELSVVVGSKRVPSYSICSRGQSRLLALSLKLAASEIMSEKMGVSPLVLLDDIDSELDGTRREKLYGFMLKSSNQYIITGTDISDEFMGLLDSNAAKFIFNKDGISRI